MEKENKMNRTGKNRVGEGRKERKGKKRTGKGRGT